MTRDEILSMEAGREMDALIAEKVMGWECLIPINECYKGCIIWKTGSPYIDGIRYTFSNINGIDVWKPSTDISAAWEVVEKMIEMGYDIVDIWHENDTGFHWFMEWIKDVKGGYANAATAPLAICRAALLAVMEAEMTNNNGDTTNEDGG